MRHKSYVISFDCLWHIYLSLRQSTIHSRMTSKSCSLSYFEHSSNWYFSIHSLWRYIINIFHLGLLSVEISSLESETPIWISSKKGEKQGIINFRPNHREMSAWNRYLFEHYAVFVLFFVQKPRQTIKIASFLEVWGFLGERVNRKHIKNQCYLKKTKAC